jgi:inhibitor of cysteine peptidase
MRTTTGLALTGLYLFALGTAGCGGGDADASPSLIPAAASGPPTPMSAATGASPRAAAEVTIGAAQNGGHVPLKAHQTLAVQLAGNPTTGYVWELQPGTDAAVLRQNGPVEYTTDPNTSPRPGRGGTFTVRFTALRPGQTWIRLRYRRPWESLGKPTPAGSFTAHVTVS